MSARDLLNEVTDAISRAEALERAGKGSEAATAYGAVADAEEALAREFPATDPDGAIARIGLVTAALRAGETARALSAARRFLGDPGCSAKVRAELQRLLDQARKDAASTLDPDPEVLPVRFRLPAAVAGASP